MKDQSKCFILTPNGYEEITYAELTHRRETDVTYRNKRFIPIHGMLMEVSEADYKAFYQDAERQKYLRKEAKRVEKVSYNALDTDEMNGEDIIPNFSPPPDDAVMDKLMLETLRLSLDKLSGDDQALLIALYFEGKSERELAKELGIPRMTLSYRKGKAIDRLRLLMKI